MSKYYGTLRTSTATTTANKCGRSDITAVAQSHDGSIAAKLYHNSDNELCVTIAMEAGRSTDEPCDVLFDGPYSKFFQLMGYVKDMIW